MPHKNLITSVKVKAVGEPDGLKERQFTGYASVFGNVDSYGDVVMPGAFTATLSEWKTSGKSIPLLFGHEIESIDGYIGEISNAVEDETGLLVTGTFDDSEDALKVYRQVKGRRINELSFAFTITESEHGELDGQPVRFLKAVQLHEVSVVPLGANSSAQINNVKRHPRYVEHIEHQLATIDRLLEEKAFPVLDSKSIVERRRYLLKMKDFIKSAPENNADADLAAFVDNETGRVQNWLKERETPQLVFTQGEVEQQTKGDSPRPTWFKSAGNREEFAGLTVSQLQDVRNGIIKGIKSGNAATLSDANRLHNIECKIAERNHAAAEFKAFQRLFNAVPPRKNQGGSHMNTKSFSLKATNLSNEINRAAEQFTEKKSATLSLTSNDLAVTHDPNILAQEKAPLTFLASLQSIPVSTRNFTFFRQLARDNKAAVVKQGDTKPTTNVGLESVTGELEVVAHLTRIDKYLARDVNGVSALLESELTFGVLEAVEKMTAAAIDADKAVVTQDFATDIHTTIRQSITKLEAVGQTPAMVVLTPEDLEVLELAKATGSGEFLNPTAPNDRGNRTVWNLPVLVSNNITDGTGYVMTNDAARIYTDGSVEIETEAGGTDFETNQIVLRCEGRFKPVVTRPGGIVKMATVTAAA